MKQNKKVASRKSLIFLIYFFQMHHVPRTTHHTSYTIYHTSRGRSSASPQGLPVRAMPAEIWSSRGTREPAAVGSHQVSTI